MTTTRKSFIELINEDFKDATVKKKCLDYALDRISRGLQDRVFDEFPHLVLDEELKGIFNDFKYLLYKITPSSDYQLSEECQKLATELQKNIILIACHEILDENGQLKPALVEQLGWIKLQPQLKPVLIVYAFMSGIRQQLTDLDPTMFKKHINAYDALCHFINPNFTQWIIDEMKSSGYQCNAIYYQQLKLSLKDKLMYFPHDKPVEAAIAGTFILAGLAGIGMALWAGLRNGNQDRGNAKPYSSPRPGKP